VQAYHAELPEKGTRSDSGEVMEKIRWVDPQEGFEYLPDRASVSAAGQQEKLQACGIDPGLFGDTVDASFFIGLAIRAGVNSGISAEGNVNMLQTLVQHRPALLGEALVVKGRITTVTRVPRGLTVDTDVWFEDHGGGRVITARRRSLKPDPESSGQRGAGQRPAPLLAEPEQATVLAEHRLTPEQVKAYSEEGNSIHYDPQAARRAGFRAPLIGGGMGVHYLMAALYADRPRQQLDLDIYFRRPIFWDDAFAVVAAAAQDGCTSAGSGDHEVMALVNRRDGICKVLTEASINQLD
jgi:hypothetical protein